MMMFPLTFLSNAFVPTDTMPGWLRAFADVNPVSHVISAIRDLANNGQVTAEVGWALLGCAIDRRDLRAAVGAQLQPEDVTVSPEHRARRPRRAAPGRGRSPYSSEDGVQPAGSGARRRAAGATSQPSRGTICCS